MTAPAPLLPDSFPQATGGPVAHCPATFPHQPYLTAFEAWRASVVVSEPVHRAWGELVALTVVREVHRYGAGPHAEPFLQTYARSMAWEDFDMALRGGADGLLRRAMESLWFRIRTRAHREALGERFTAAARVAHTDAERSGWEPRYSVAALARPVLTSPYKLELGEVAVVYDGEGTHRRRMEAQWQAPDLDTLRASLFGPVVRPRG